MKKLFTLLTLALISIGSAWGDSKEFIGGTSAGQLNVNSGSGTGSLVITPVTVTVVSPGGKTQNRQIWKDGETKKNEMAFSFSSSAQSDPSTKYAEITIAEGYKITGLTVRGAINNASGATYYAYCFADAFSTDAGAVIGVGELVFPGYEGTESGADVTMSSIASNTRTIRIYRQVRYDSEGKTINGTAGSNYPSTAPTAVNIAKITVTYEATRTATSEVLAASYAVKVDDTALTLNASTNGYSVSGNTITLSDNITATSTPDNVELVKTITYDDASTSDADVAVTFDGTVTAGYFIGTATIGLTGSETKYTVRVKQDVTPTLVLSTASGSLNLKSYETGTAKVTLTGANLANGTFTAPTASGVTVTPATVEITDGTIDQEFTITPSATTAAETVLAFAYTGATTQNYTLNYSKTAQRTLTKTNVTEATTWDWSKAYNEDVQLSGTTSPTKSEEFLLSNLAEVKNDENFNAQALSVICEYATRKQGDVYMLQGNKVAFTTTVPGIIKVTFSNTGNRTNDADGNRYLYVNGENTGVSSYQSSSTKEAVAYVAAGEVVLTAKTGNDLETMIRFIKIEFETLADADEVTVTSAGYATFVLTQDAYFDATDGVTAYAAKANGETIKLTEVKVAPASTPLVIKAAAGTYTLKKATSISPAAVSTDINDLVAGSVTGDGASHYVLGKEGSTVGFGLLANSVVLPATKAYIPASKFSSAPSRAFYEIDIDGISTGINMVNGEGLKVNGSETYYDLSGRRVLHPTKGLYIVNGKKVVIK